MENLELEIFFSEEFSVFFFPLLSGHSVYNTIEKKKKRNNNLEFRFSSTYDWYVPQNHSRETCALNLRRNLLRTYTAGVRINSRKRDESREHMNPINSEKKNRIPPLSLRGLVQKEIKRGKLHYIESSEKWDLQRATVKNTIERSVRVWAWKSNYYTQCLSDLVLRVYLLCCLSMIALGDGEEG